MSESIKKLKDKVEHCLKEYPSTRDSDVTLTICVWAKFHNDHIKDVDGEKSVNVKSLYELPREDNIKRIRATFQNTEKQYLPRSLKIAQKRGILEEEWRNFYGYPSILNLL